MRTVYLYGKLAEEFGPSFRIRANTVGAAIKLLEANYRGKFYKQIIGGYFRVVAGKSVDAENSIQFDNVLVRSELNLGSKDLHIMPVAEGSGGGLRIILGVALIAAAFAFSGGALATTAFTAFGAPVAYSSIALFGASLVLGGISQLLTPTPKIGGDSYAQREAADERPSFLFNGAVNTIEQGGPVPVVYGRMMVGSTVISGGIKTEQI